MNVPKTNNKGFTIIEVVLVLAIAALIFLMVFIALPALQRGQRDTQRKNDIGRVQTAINNYQSSNRNAIPPLATVAQGTAFIAAYLTPAAGDKFTDPDGTDYSIKAGPIPANTVFDDTSSIIYSNPGSTCGATDTALTAAGTQKIALQFKLEGGGVVCVNN